MGWVSFSSIGFAVGFGKECVEDERKAGQSRWKGEVDDAKMVGILRAVKWKG